MTLSGQCRGREEKILLDVTENLSVLLRSPLNAANNVTPYQFDRAKTNRIVRSLHLYHEKVFFCFANMFKDLRNSTENHIEEALPYRLLEINLLLLI